MAKLTKAVDNNGEIIDIERATAGITYYCPVCNNLVFPKNNIPIEDAIREHHFAHYEGANCQATDETLLIMWAKEVIQSEKALMLPSTDNMSRPSGLVHFQTIEQEKLDPNNGIVPYLEGVTESGNKILIEFFVSQRMQHKKRKAIIKNNLNCIEIDLKHVDADIEEIGDFLLKRTEHREWVEDNYYDSFYWQRKAVELICTWFNNGTLRIRIDKEYDLKDYGFDACNRNNYFEGFQSDLLLSQRPNSGWKKAYIAISMLARRRKKVFFKPDRLRVIDIIIRNKEDYDLLVKKEGILEDSDLIVFDGFKS